MVCLWMFWCTYAVCSMNLDDREAIIYAIFACSILFPTKLGDLWIFFWKQKMPRDTRVQICPLYSFGNYPPQMVPRDLNIGETRVWRLDETSQIYNRETSVLGPGGVTITQCTPNPRFHTSPFPGLRSEPSLPSFLASGASWLGLEKNNWSQVVQNIFSLIRGSKMRYTLWL